jgi:hypothetical protein
MNNIKCLVSDYSKKIRGISVNKEKYEKLILNNKANENDFNFLMHEDKEQLVLMLLVKDNFINKVLDELGYFEEESK